MDIPDSAQIVISLAGNLLAAAFQMIGHKLLGVAVFVFSTGLLWWSILPLMANKGLVDIQSLPLWIGGGWAALIIIGLLWGWGIIRSTPATIPGVQISSKSQSGGVTGNYGSVTINYASPTQKERPEPVTSVPSLSLDTQNAMVVRLRDVLSSFGGHLRVTMEPKAEASYSFAHTLAGIFRDAGWETKFRDPLDPKHGFHMQPNPMNRGIQILGNSNQLVRTVAGVLEGAGCTQVSSAAHTFQTLTPGTPLPKLGLDQNAVSIEVSYRR